MLLLSDIINLSCDSTLMYKGVSNKSECVTDDSVRVAIKVRKVSYHAFWILLQL